MKHIVENTVFVFDLDDTLYSERDYYLSGIQAVVDKASMLFKSDVRSLVCKLIADGEEDLWGGVCKSLGLPDSVKDCLLWEYRLHTPNINLSPEVDRLLNLLKEHSAGIAVLTDGRIVTQKIKLLALGLDNLPAFISETTGAEKPSQDRFVEIQDIFEASEFVYLGDNPQKDFLAPNRLGWSTYGVRCNGQNIHSQDVRGLEKDFLPDHWLSSLIDLRKYLC